MTGRPASHDYRIAFACAIAAAVLVVAGVALWHAEQTAGALDLGDAPLAVLDTVSVAGRVVLASIGGTVQAVAPGTAWIGTADHALALRGVADDSLRTEDHVLVSGRLRESAGGARWLDVHTLTHIESVTLGVGRRSGERPTVQPED